MMFPRGLTILVGRPGLAVSPGVLADVGDIKQDPRNILVLGWTDEAGINSNDPLLAGRDEAKLSDTMMLVRLDPTAATIFRGNDAFVRHGSQVEPPTQGELADLFSEGERARAAAS